MSKKKLIINADDFGQSDGVNKGVILAYEQGILTSASLMVRYPAAYSASSYAKRNNLDLGLHVDLGEWIYKDKKWFSLYEVVSTDDEIAVREELNKQLEIFYRIHGKIPSHIDSHQHVHKQENIKPVFLEMARKLNITLRDCTKNVNYCGEFYGQSSDSSAFHEGISVNNLNRIISTLPDGITELACHPGVEIEFQTMYKIEREIEVNSLCSKNILEIILNSEIELSSFAGIPF